MRRRGSCSTRRRGLCGPPWWWRRWVWGRRRRVVRGRWQVGEPELKREEAGSDVGAGTGTGTCTATGTVTGTATATATSMSMSTSTSTSTRSGGIVRRVREEVREEVGPSWVVRGAAVMAPWGLLVLVLG